MATIRAAIAMYDGVTGPLQHMHRAMNILINSFETMQSTSGNAVDVRAIQEARDELAQAGAAYKIIEQHIQKADQQQQQFNRHIQGGTAAADGLWRKLKGIAATVGGMAAVKTALNISDQLTSTNARLANAQKNFIQQEQPPPDLGWADTAPAVVTSQIQYAATGLPEVVEQAARFGSLRENQAVQMEFSGVGLPEVVEQAAQFSSLRENQAVQMEFSGVGLPEVVEQAAQFKGMGVNQTAQITFTDDSSIADLQRQVMASARRSRSAYLDTAAAVAKMGTNARDAFSGMEEVIAFTELVNKSFIIGGASAQEQSAAMLQLTQAMAAGVLRGEELNAIFEQAPSIVQNIADYMDVPIGRIREMASEGQITADIVKNAMFSAAEEIEAQFEDMPITWNQRWTMMKNTAQSIFGPILSKINNLANSADIEAVTTKTMAALAGVARVAEGVFDLLVNGASWVTDNWSWIAPIVGGVATAFFVLRGAIFAYNAVQTVSNGLAAVAAARSAFKAKAAIAEAAATTTAKGAQVGLNAAMYACPIVWIIMLIIALIAIFYAAVAAVNKFAGTSMSATGLICGAFMVLVAFIGNLLIGFANGLIQRFWTIFVYPFLGIVEWILNICNGGFDSFGDAVASLIGNIISWFLSLGKIVTTIIDAIFGTDWTSNLSALQENVLSWGKNDHAVTLDRNAPLIDHRFEYGAAWDAGYSFGEGIDDKVSGLFTYHGPEEDDHPFDPPPVLENILNNTGDTAANTAASADALHYAEEDLAYMRDIAEREAINRFTTAEIHIEQHNENHISKDVDVDGIMDLWVADFAEKAEISGEGVHP